jgi:hypothetical protein
MCSALSSLFAAFSDPYVLYFTFAPLNFSSQWPHDGGGRVVGCLGARTCSELRVRAASATPAVHQRGASVLQRLPFLHWQQKGELLVLQCELCRQYHLLNPSSMHLQSQWSLVEKFNPRPEIATIASSILLWGHFDNSRLLIIIFLGWRLPSDWTVRKWVRIGAEKAQQSTGSTKEIEARGQSKILFLPIENKKGSRFRQARLFSFLT